MPSQLESLFFILSGRITHSTTYTRALFEQKELLKYLFICPPRLCLLMHILCNHRSLYSLYPLSVSNSIPFPSVLFLRNAANRHRSTLFPFILVDKYIVYSPHDFGLLAARLVSFFFREPILHHFPL